MRERLARHRVYAAIRDADDRRKRGPMAIVNRQERFFMAETFGACLLGVRALGCFSSRRQTAFAGRARGSDPTSALLLCRSNHVLQTLFDGEQLPQPLIIGFAAAWTAMRLGA